MKGIALTKLSMNEYIRYKILTQLIKSKLCNILTLDKLDKLLSLHYYFFPSEKKKKKKKKKSHFFL